MLHYIIQTIAFQLFFLLAYDLFLKKETFFNWNRIYLLATAVLSMLLPFIKINRFKEVVPQEYIIALPEIILGNIITNPNNTIIQNSEVVQQNTIPVFHIILYIGIAVALTLFIYKLIRIVFFISKNPKQKSNNITVVNLQNSNAAFSFFNIVFLGENLKIDEKEAILKHEIIHVKEKHTLDLLFFEVLRIILWFNPLVYMYQNRIEALHEYIADAKAVKHQDKTHYYQNLLAQVFDTQNISFINPFFKQSLIKKRIVMLAKSKSRQINLFKYALLIPMVFGMLIYTSCSITQELEIPQEDTINQELTDEELKAKLSDEYNQMKADGADFTTIYNAFKIQTDNYILTREEHYRFFTILNEATKSSSKELSSELRSKFHKTYEEYLEWKKTDEAKEHWENNTHNGVLKLIVNDFKNMTPEEQEKYDRKMELLTKDDFFTKFIITNGKTVVFKLTNEPLKTQSSSGNDDTRMTEVPFAVVDQAPVFPECENLNTNKERKECTSHSIAKHVNVNFNTKLANELGLKGRQRIYVIFKIDTEGNVYGVKSRASHPEIEAEAIRVIKTLPKMIPGEQNGEKVNVPYSLPIIFQVSE